MLCKNIKYVKNYLIHFYLFYLFHPPIGKRVKKKYRINTEKKNYLLFSTLTIDFKINMAAILKNLKCFINTDKVALSTVSFPESEKRKKPLYLNSTIHYLS